MEPLSEKDRADLVAYLDGELPESESRALETRLSLDPEARAEAVALRKTWELLDYLPRPEPSPHFTHRTLERVSAQIPLTRGRWPAWAIGVGWAAALLLAGGAGFAGVRLLTGSRSEPGGARQEKPDPLAGMRPEQVEEQLARNLPLLENRRLYENVDGIKFLRALDDPDLFGDAE